ncbi:MAG: PDC sensor domain-containing protein, partial [Deltaproteobacteria bacterium]|nr:PDC sensor domain-containing protein [Deltaproteobacteria bacterium]
MIPASSFRRILYLVVFLAMLPPLALIIYSGLEDRQRAIADAREKSDDILEAMAERYSLLAETSRTLLATLARLSAFRGGEASESSSLLRGLLQKRAAYANLLLIDGQGRVIASARPMHGRASIDDTSYLHEAALTRAFTVGGLHPDPVTGEEVFPFLLPVPRADSQGIRLYLMASARPESGLEPFAESGLARNARVYMRSGRDASVYAHPPGPDEAEKAAEAESWRK